VLNKSTLNVKTQQVRSLPEVRRLQFWLFGRWLIRVSHVCDLAEATKDSVPPEKKGVERAERI